ncbi:MAG: hypothetical protein ACRDGB_01425, partial [Candidatus Limnocylindria bacterium]
VLAALSGVLGQRHYPVPWQLGRAVAIVILAAGLSAAALLGPDHAAWRVGCIVAYVPLLVVLRIVDLAQFSSVMALARRN